MAKKGWRRGEIRQQQLSPHGPFPEFKVTGEKNEIVHYPVIKTENKGSEFQTAFQT
jgi:hypothetical protein